MKIINTYIVRNSSGYLHKVHELENGEYVIEKHVGGGIMSYHSLDKITKEQFENLKSNWK